MTSEEKRNSFFAILRAIKGDLLSGSQTLSFYYSVTWQKGQGLSVTSVLRTHPIHNDHLPDLLLKGLTTIH